MRRGAGPVKAECVTQRGWLLAEEAAGRARHSLLLALAREGSVDGRLPPAARRAHTRAAQPWRGGLWRLRVGGEGVQCSGGGGETGIVYVTR